MRLTTTAALLALGVALAAAPTFAMADTYTLANFSGGVSPGNANVQAPFTGAGITQGMPLTGSFLIDNNSDTSGVFNNVFYSSYPDAAQIPGATDFSFAIGDLLFTGAGDPTGGAIQYHNGHFNGFAYSSDFDYQNVGYNLTISGGSFLISEIDNSAFKVSGYINIGDNNVTGGTPFTPPPPTTGPGGGGGVPEPASWILMMVGFGSAGAMMRRRQSLAFA